MVQPFSRCFRNRVRVLGVLPLAFGVLIGPAVAEPASESAPRPRLELTKSEYEIGTVEPGASLEFTFPVRNAGDAPLEVDAHAGCGCMVTSSDRVIAPGKTGAVNVTLRTVRFRGEVSKHIELHTNDPDTPRTILTIHGNFVEPLGFIPGQEITLPLDQGQPAAEEVRIICRERTPLTIEKIESSVPFVTAQVTGQPTSAQEAATVGWSIVTLQVGVTAEAPARLFKGTVTLTTNLPDFRQITLTVNGRPRGLAVTPPRVHFDGADAGMRGRDGLSAPISRPSPFRAQRAKATHAEVAELMERIEDLRAIQSLRLSAPQVETLLKVLKPAVEQLQEQDRASADRLVTLLPLLRQAANPLTGSSALTTRAEAEYRRLEQADQQAHARMRDQLRAQVRLALERIITPAQRAALLGAGRPGAVQLRRPQLAQARPAASLDTFITRTLLTPAAVEGLEAELMQSQARAELGRQARVDLFGTSR